MDTKPQVINLLKELAMNKFLKFKYILLCLTVAIFAFGCGDDIDDLVTSLETDRLFSPVDLETRIVNQTGVRLSWKEVKKAETYNIEIYANGNEDYSGTPVKSISGVTFSELPYTITGLLGDESYSVRVQAIGQGIADSKWTSATVKTDTEQIFQNMEDDDLKATEVTLRWLAGAEVTAITVEPGGINRTLTAEEKAAGVVTIAGLTGETAYKATLLNGSKIRGIREFTTTVDIGNAIPVNPEDDLATLLADAKDGDAFALFPGKYGTSTKFIIKANVEIKAVRPNDKPILSGLISIEDGASLLLKEVVLDGTGNESNQAIIFGTANANYGAITVDGCEIKNHDKGLFYLNVASVVESITFNNCIISNIPCNGGDFMDSRAGAIKTWTLSNSTVYNSCLDRDFIRYDDKSKEFPGVSSIINVTDNTLIGVSNGASRRLLYVRFANNTINFRNNIIANTAGIFSNQKNTAVPTFSKNNYFQAPGLFTGGSTTSLIFDNSATSHNPQFEDAATGNFKVNNLDVTVGDPRWLQ